MVNTKQLEHTVITSNPNRQPSKLSSTQAQQLPQYSPVRHMPKLNNGVQDEWKALIDLQNQAADQAERKRREQQVAAKRKYMADIQSEIDKKRMEKKMQQNLKEIDAQNMI